MTSYDFTVILIITITITIIITIIIIIIIRDGRVCVWDPRQKEKPVAVFEPSNSDSDCDNDNNNNNSISRDCWCVAFGNSYNNTERSVIAGYDNGKTS